MEKSQMNNSNAMYSSPNTIMPSSSSNTIAFHRAFKPITWLELLPHEVLLNILRNVLFFAPRTQYVHLISVSPYFASCTFSILFESQSIVILPENSSSSSLQTLPHIFQIQESSTDQSDQPEVTFPNGSSNSIKLRFPTQREYQKLTTIIDLREVILTRFSSRYIDVCRHIFRTLAIESLSLECVESCCQGLDAHGYTSRNHDIYEYGRTFGKCPIWSLFQFCDSDCYGNHSTSCNIGSYILRMSTVKSFSYQCFYLSMNNWHLVHLLEAFPNLEDLVVSGNIREVHHSTLSRMHTLRIRNKSPYIYVRLEVTPHNLPKNFDHLVKELNCSYALGIEDVARLGTSMNNLEVLCGSVKSNAVDEFMKAFPRLRSLKHLRLNVSGTSKTPLLTLDSIKSQLNV